MPDPKRKVSLCGETEDAEHVDKVLERKNRRDRGKRRYSEERKNG